MAADVEFPNCDVCGEKGEAVACSSIGPFSFSYCNECLNCGAEPLSIWHATIWICDGLVDDTYKETAVSYDGDKYIEWDEIINSYDAKEFEDIAF